MIENKLKKKNEKQQLHVRVTNKCIDSINNLVEDYGSKSNVIEQAVDFFKKYKKNWDFNQQIWNRTRKELNMLLVGKTTFMSFISGDFKNAWKDNIATEVIEWISKKNITDLTLTELLSSIKDVWVAANYFYDIQIESIDNNDYKVIFYHTLNKTFGEYWANYFKTWLEYNRKCEVEFFVRNETFILLISKFTT